MSQVRLGNSLHFSIETNGKQDLRYDFKYVNLEKYANSQTASFFKQGYTWTYSPEGRFNFDRDLDI